MDSDELVSLSDVSVKLLEKLNDGEMSDVDLAQELSDTVDIDLYDAKKIVREWREPDWPVEFTIQFHPDKDDTYRQWRDEFNGWEPPGEVCPPDFEVSVTWEIDRNKNMYAEDEWMIDLVSVNGKAVN